MTLLLGQRRSSRVPQLTCIWSKWVGEPAYGGQDVWRVCNVKPRQKKFLSFELCLAWSFLETNMSKQLFCSTISTIIVITMAVIIFITICSIMINIMMITMMITIIITMIITLIITMRITMMTTMIINMMITMKIIMMIINGDGHG